MCQQIVTHRLREARKSYTFALAPNLLERRPKEGGDMQFDSATQGGGAL